jgi:hypothetical protein
LATEDNKAFPNSAWYHLVESYTGLNRSEAKTALDDLEADGKVTIDGTSGEIAVRVIQPIIKEIATAEKT